MKIQKFRFRHHAAMPGEGCPTRFSEERCMWIRPENLQLSDVRVRHMW